MIDPKDYQKIQGWFHHWGFYEKVVAKAENGARFVEIGAWLGKSTYYLAAMIANSGKDIKFWTVDTWEGSEEHKDHELVKAGKLHEEFLKNIEPVKDWVTPIKGDSSATAAEFEDDSLDFIFVDGDHSMEGVEKDLNAWWPKLKVGGIMAGDDFCWKGVHRNTSHFFPFLYCWSERSAKSVIWMVRKGGEDARGWIPGSVH